jgi:glycosyltransferase involved in cell wall biosynthesis
MAIGRARLNETTPGPNDGRLDDVRTTEPRPVVPTVVAVVPAHNEERRIGRVIEALLESQAVGQVIVVNDGSSDRTGEVAREYSPRVVVEDLPRNLGKGGAMLHGARKASGSDVILFLDADLIGLKPAHVCALLEPVVSGAADMAVGQFKGGKALTDLAQFLVPYISGQRAIRRELFLMIPDLDRVGYGIEMAITFFVKRMRRPWKMVTLRGVTHPMKEEKLGLVRGAAARTRMYKQMLRFGIRYMVAPRASLMKKSRRDQ